MINWFYKLSIGARKRITVLVLTAVILVTTSTAFLVPRTAQAFLVEDILGAPIAAGKWIWDKISGALEFAWEHGGAIAYRNAAKTFTSRIAYDMATSIASGGKGQQPLFVTKGWGEYLKDVGDSAAGDFLETLAQENGYIKFGLCEPVGLGSLGFSAPHVKLIIGLTLFDEIKPRKPRCSLSDMQRNWQEALADPKKFLKNYNIVFDPKQHDLGVTLRLKQNIIKEQEAQKAIEEAQLLANKGLKSLTEPIAGGIKTPAVFLEKQFGIGLESASNEPLQVTGDVIADALGVFTNTLASKLMKNLFQKGLVPNPSAGRSPGGPSGYFPPSYGVEYAMQINTNISTPTFVLDKNYDIIQELSSCPDIRYASVNNCTIDSKFEQLLRKAGEGTALSVGDIVNSKEWGYLGGRLLERNRPNDVKTPTAWYLSDLQKLRRARIIPVGWELAAEKFGGKGVTLKQVVDGFAQVGTDNKCGTPDLADGESRFCGLVDPNWIIRAPTSQCRIKGAGQMLQVESGTRQDTCVDEEQCVAEDEAGNCQAWGYCLAEKNTWRFSGDSCEFPAGSGYSPFATCQTFDSTTGNQLSVLTNSLENFNDSVCASAAGCRWYSRTLNSQESTGSVDRYEQDEADRFYLKNIDKYSCQASEQGCTAFLRLANINATAVASASGNNPAEKLLNQVVNVDGATTESTYSSYAKISKTYLKQAPDYLNCYDTTAAGLANTSNDSEQCKNYLNWCSSYEVGCELYSSQQGAPPVPAIIQAEDFCPNECVGLNSFIQTSSFFEPTPPSSVNFIPTTAKSCPAQAAGCEEFTNIEQTLSGEQREYYVKLRQCILPDDPQAATFFTWVGSDLTGFQLKTWRLQKDINDAPFVATIDKDCSADFGSNPDCKQFYGLTGIISYRLAADVVTASIGCSKYRATNVTNINCGTTGGNWNDGLNACIYHAIPNEGVKCEAATNGCREYKGPTANNIQLVFPVSTFGDQEQVEGQPIDATPASGWRSGENSNEALNAFGHSFASGVSGVSNVITRYIEKGINPDHRYLITFWVKHYDHTPAPAVLAPVGAVLMTAPIATLSDDWQFYKIEISSPGVVTGGVFLTIRADQQFVIDNIVMRDLSDTFYVIKNSWTTPSICGAEYLGCSAYTDRSGKNATLISFSQLCRPEAIGCEPIINTQNSATPQVTTTVVGAPAADIVTPADNIVYRVYDQAKACTNKAEACRLVGQPSLDVSGSVTGWGDKFVRLDPDNFNVNNPISPLCTKAQDRCQNFTSNKATATFKDPGNSVCEYKQVGATAEYNWYKKGTNEPCNYLINPSFEKTEDHGNNLVIDGDFEGTLFNWKMDQVNAWSISTTGERSFLGETSAKHTGGQSNLWQQIRLSPGIAYTARVQVFSTTTEPRALRIYGCGVDITDTTQTANTWEKLQLTFIPTTSLCTLQLRALETAYFDSVSVYRAESFPGWLRNGNAAADNKLVTLSAVNSIPGQYWGSQVIEIESSSQMYSGIWSDQIDLATVSTVDTVNPRVFTVTAHLYIPDIPQNANMLTWELSQHAVPEGAVAGPGCEDRTVNGVTVWTCHHYDTITGFDPYISGAEKGKWIYKQRVIQADPGVKYLSVGVIANFGTGFPTGCSWNPNEYIPLGTQPKCTSQICTADSCRANQVIYVDQISIVEGAIQPAYLCNQEQSGCTGFYDPALTQQMYYYLNNDSLDKKSCAGQVSEKAGCMLFADMSNKSVTFNANESYNLSRAAINNLTSPSTAPPADSNVILKVRRDRVCGEWASCLSTDTKYDPASNSVKSICYDLGRCTSYGEQGTGKCGNWKIINNPAPLTYNNYITRNTSWSSYDYSGYSIPWQYPLDTLMQKNYSTNPEQDDIRLTRINPTIRACTSGVVGATDEGKSCTDNDECISGSCAYTLRCGGTSNVECSVLYSSAAPCSLDRVCQYQDLGISGGGPGSVEKNYPQTIPKLCRVYPKSDAPFPSNLASFNPGDPLTEVDAGGIKSKQQPYQDANICQEGEECECNYQQVTYSMSENRFYSIKSGSPIVPDRLLVDENDDIYSRKKQQDIFLGLKGYCLEKDKTRAINGGRDNPCLTWLPLDVVSGELSLYDYTPQAGFNNFNIAYYCSVQGSYQYGGNSFVLPYGSAASGGACKLVGDNWTAETSLVLPPGPPIYRDDIESIHIGEMVTIDGDEDDGACRNDDDDCVRQDVWLSDYNNWCVKVDYEENKSVCEMPVACDTSAKINYMNNSGSLFVPRGINIDWWIDIDEIGIFCDARKNDGGKNWGSVAAMAIFDANSRFLGINASICSDYEGVGHAGVRNVEVRLKKNYCSELTKVVDGVENKAWTNRTLNPSSGYKPRVGTGGETYTFTTAGKPFGAVVGQLSTTDAGRLAPLVPIQQSGPLYAAAPYSCSSSWPDYGCVVSDRYNRCVGGSQSPNACTAGSPPTCPEGICIGTALPVAKEPAANSFIGVAIIQDLFARIYDIFRLTGITPEYDRLSGLNLPPFSLDVSGSPLGTLATGVPASPLVRQVVFDNNMPLEGLDGFSIKTATGIFTSNDVEVVSPAAVSVLFYAYNANGEQMPLTEVRVDWTGNPDMAAGSIGKYKNHKHLCLTPTISGKVCGSGPQSGDIIRLGLPCQSDNDCISDLGFTVQGACSEAICGANDAWAGRACGPSVLNWEPIPGTPGDASCGNVAGSCGTNNPSYNFGDSKDACIDDSGANQGYFNFTRILTCPENGAGLNTCANAQTAQGELCWDRNALAGEGACVYRPRVLVKDNWEWCATGQYGTACLVTSPAAWLNFDGKILVRP